MDDWKVERMRPDDAARIRAIRLRAIADAPDAFSRTLAEEEALPIATWRARLEDARGATFVARSADRDVGLVFGAPYGDEGAGLFGMWVDRSCRGFGVARALVTAVIVWARAHGHRRLLLDVADANVPAVRLYEGLGFVPTGVTGSLPPPREHVTEHQRALDL